MVIKIFTNEKLAEIINDIVMVEPERFDRLATEFDKNADEDTAQASRELAAAIRAKRRAG